MGNKNITTVIMLFLIAAVGISVIVTFNVLNSNKKLTTNSRASELNALIVDPGKVTPAPTNGPKPTSPPVPTSQPTAQPTSPPSCGTGCDSCRNGQRTCQAPCNSGCCSRTESCGSDGGGNTPTMPSNIPTNPPTPITSYPANFKLSCNHPGNSMTLSWSADPNAVKYSLRMDSKSDPWGGLTDNVNCSSSKGDFCRDIPGNSLSYSVPVNPIDTYDFWIHSRDAAGNFGPAQYVNGVKCAPNCNIKTAPASIKVGQTATFTVDFSSSTGSLGGQLFMGEQFTNIKYQDFGTASKTGTMTATWVPTSAQIGTQQLFCRAWNDAIAECRPQNLVDAAPRYACQGPKVSHSITVLASSSPTGNPTATPTGRPTGVPSGEPTPYPDEPPASCTLHSKGDANCDGSIDLADYACWKSQYGTGRKLNNCYTSDFNHADNPAVSMLDFAIWRLNYQQNAIH